MKFKKELTTMNNSDIWLLKYMFPYYCMCWSHNRCGYLRIYSLQNTNEQGIEAMVLYT